MARPTRLHLFLTSAGVTTVALAATTSYSRKHIAEIRGGKSRNFGFEVLSAIVRAVSGFVGREVQVEELFEVWPSEGSK